MKKIRRPWTPEELDYLRENFAKQPIHVLSGRFARTEQQIYQKAWYLGLPSRRKYWSDEDLATMARMFEDITIPVETIASHFGRSKQAIYARASKMGLRRTSENGQ